MKRVFFLFTLFIFTGIASAQVKYVYCEIVGTSNLIQTKVTVVIDYGELLSPWQNNAVKDEMGKAKKFNSMIDALNYMGDQGWEFVQAYAVTSSQSANVYHYLLKMERKLEEGE
jgi:hypothetical protein